MKGVHRLSCWVSSSLLYCTSVKRQGQSDSCGTVNSGFSITCPSSITTLRYESVLGGRCKEAWKVKVIRPGIEKPLRAPKYFFCTPCYFFLKRFQEGLIWDTSKGYDKTMLPFELCYGEEPEIETREKKENPVQAGEMKEKAGLFTCTLYLRRPWNKTNEVKKRNIYFFLQGSLAGLASLSTSKVESAVPATLLTGYLFLSHLDVNIDKERPGNILHCSASVPWWQVG